VHIIPRKTLDFKDNDDVYEHLDHSERELISTFSRPSPKIDEQDRIARTDEDMAKEAAWLASLFAEE